MTTLRPITSPPKRLAETFTGKTEDDFLLMPFLTLYRQAFELELKNTIKFLINIRILYVDGKTSELLVAIKEERIKQDFGHNLYKLLSEVKKHYDALELPEAFPKGVEKLIVMLHDADSAGTAFRYAGQLPNVQEHADFPDLAALLDDQFRMLSVVEDYVDGLYSAGPTLNEIAGDYY